MEMARPLRILHVIPYYYPAFSYGGPVRVAYEMTRRLATRGHQVTVYTTDVRTFKERSSETVGTVDGVRVHYFRNMNHSLASRYHVFFPIGLLPALIKTCRQFDLIHIHEYYTFMTVAAAAMGRRQGIPAVLSPHGSLPVNPARGNEGRKHLFNWFFQKMIFGGLWGGMAINRQEQEDFQRMGMPLERITIVPNGIDTASFKNLPDGQVFRKTYGIHEKSTVILFVGRLHEIKGLDTLLRAFAELSRIREDLILLLVGPDDGYLDSLRKLMMDLDLEKHVVLTGFLTGREKIAAYSASDVFVLPSYDEVWGMVVNEAMASGLPVIATDRVGASGKLVLDGVTGRVVRARDTEMLRDTMEQLCSDVSMRRKMGLRGRDIIFDQYDWSRIVEQLEETYRRIITEARNTRSVMKVSHSI